MTSTPAPSRRQLLAGVGALTLGAGLGRRVLAREPPYTRYTYAATPGGTALRVAWFETYNGEFQESNLGDSSETTPEEWDPDDLDAYTSFAGPVVTLPDVQPGDTGAIVVGLSAVQRDLAVWLKPTLTSSLENGLTEPEVAAGDTTTDANSDGNGGELADAIAVEVFHDSGVGGVGRCDGTRTDVLGIAEPLVFTGSLASLVPAGEYADTEVDPDHGLRLSLGDGGEACLPAGVSRCIGIAWSIPDGGNELQTDSVEFSFQFGAIECNAAGRVGPNGGGSTNGQNDNRDQQ